MFIDDIHLTIDMYGDEGNYGLLVMTPNSKFSSHKIEQKNVSNTNMTPELIGDAVAEYVRKNFWRD